MNLIDALTGLFLGVTSVLFVWFLSRNRVKEVYVEPLIDEATRLNDDNLYFGVSDLSLADRYEAERMERIELQGRLRRTTRVKQ